MQAHVSPQEKEPELGPEPEPDPELIALSKRVEALERKLAEVQSPDIPRRRANHGSVDCFDLRSISLGGI